MSPVALITGASRGLGLALARELAGRGWSLILDARGEAALETARAELAAHTRVLAIPGDIADTAHRVALLDAARELGRLDLLVHNASTLGPSPRPNLLDFSIDDFETVFRVNVAAPLALTQALWPQLTPEARIIAISSDAGVEPYAGWGGYGASKAALEQLFAILAAEQPERLVYWVDPGDMRTQMHQEAFPGEDISDRPLPEASVPGLLALIEGDPPSGRYQARALPAAETRHVHELRVAMTVADFDASLRLFSEGLGLTEVEGWKNPDGRGIILAAGRATLELIDEAQAATIDRIEAGSRVSGPIRLAFEVPNVTQATKDMQQAGMQPLRANVLTPWGDRNTRLRTAEGTQITLFERETIGEEVAT